MRDLHTIEQIQAQKEKDIDRDQLQPLDPEESTWRRESVLPST